MSETDKGRSDRDIVDRMLDPDIMLLGQLRLTAEQTDRLRAALKEVNELARSDPSEATARLISDFAVPDADRSVRDAAVAALGLIPGRQSDRALASMLSAAPPSEHTGILQALARAGGVAGLAAIQALPPADSLRMEKIRAYAEVAISYRIGKQPSGLGEQMVTPSPRDLPIRPVSKRRLGEILSRLDHRPFGVELRDDLGFCFQCADRQQFVLLNREIPIGGAANEIFARRSIAAVVVSEESEHRHVVLRRAVLLRPDGDGASMSVLSLEGDVLMVGELRPEEGGAALHLRDVGEARPITIDGKLTEKGLELSARIYPSVRRPRLSGQAITRDSGAIRVAHRRSTAPSGLSGE
jgi:hypothetical protein